ncbi:MAG: TldD/PmbA family protein, partial [Dehalococcoidia bacterium]|nr:TldD/PmbA family protein [Dehalococcoidia bacterium]
MERLLELALQQASSAEVFEASSESAVVHFEANKLKQLENRQSSTVALRIVREGRMGFAAASGAYEPERLVEMAVETSTYGAEAQFDFPGASVLMRPKTYDSRIVELETDALIQMGTDVIDRVSSAHADVQCEGLVSIGAGMVHIVNSSGLDVSSRQTSIGAMMEGIRISGTDMLFVGDSISSASLLDDVSSIADTMLAQLSRAAELAHIRTGTYPVLFTPHGVDIALLLPLAVAFNGKNVLEKSSRLAGRQGEQVFTSALSLWDDSTIDGRPTTSPFDAEGVASRRVPLIEAGVVGEFLFDLQTGAEAGMATTGSGRRADARSQVRPGMGAFVVGEGDTSFKQMLGAIQEGLVVEELIGAGQGNLLSGDFGGNVLLGYKVEHGKIVGRVKDTMIAGNIIDALSRDVVIGNDSRWVGGNLRTPSILCDGISVSSKGG